MTKHQEIIDTLNDYYSYQGHLLETGGALIEHMNYQLELIRRLSVELLACTQTLEAEGYEKGSATTVLDEAIAYWKENK